MVSLNFNFVRGQQLQTAGVRTRTTASEDGAQSQGTSNEGGMAPIKSKNEIKPAPWGPKDPENPPSELEPQRPPGDDFEPIKDDSEMESGDSAYMAVDPLTGKSITKDEWNELYDNGNKIVYVPVWSGGGTTDLSGGIPRFVPNVKYEAMTANEYLERYGDSPCPPKASLVNPDEE